MEFINWVPLFILRGGMFHRILKKLKKKRKMRGSGNTPYELNRKKNEMKDIDLRFFKAVLVVGIFLIILGIASIFVPAWVIRVHPTKAYFAS